MHTLSKKMMMPSSVKVPPSSGPMIRRRPARMSTSTRLPAAHNPANIVKSWSGAIVKAVIRSKFSRMSL
jgi:hypothetical protein